MNKKWLIGLMMSLVLFIPSKIMAADPKCGWCGSACAVVNLKTCKLPARPLRGVNCVSELGKCVLKPVVASTCVPRPACLDGVKDANGRVHFCEPAAKTNYCPVRVVKGDANGDGKVDLVDFSIWKNEYLNFVEVPQTSFNPNLWKSDFNSDSKVNLVDFSIWKNDYLIK